MAYRDTFGIGAYWGRRHENAEDCARRLHACLSGLAGCDPIFRTWFEKGHSRKQALLHKVDLTIEGLTGVLEPAPVGRKGTPESNEVDWYSAGLWNGREDDDGVCSFSCTCGGFVSKVPFPNHFFLDLPCYGDAVDRIVEREMVEALLGVVVRAWEPDWAVVTSGQTRDLHEVTSKKLHCAWIYFLSARRGSAPVLPPPAYARPLERHGTIVVAMDHRPDVALEEDVLILKRTYDALDEAGLCGPIAV